MKTSTPELDALLAGTDAYRMAELIDFELVGGSVLRYSCSDFRVTHGGNPYSIDGPSITRGQVRTSVGLAVDTMDMVIGTADPAHTIGGVPFIRAILMDGAFDGARVKVQRAFFSEWDEAAVGVLHIFSGRVSAVDGSRHEANLTVSSDLELLNAKLPRNVYQAGCSKVVYSTACGANKAAKTVAGTVSAVLDDRLRFDTALTQDPGWFEQGRLTFTSGANSGVTRTVKTFGADGSFAFALATPFPIAVGDAFSVYPGCDKTQATCNSKFANVIRFRGFPYVPAPETIT